MTEPAEKPKKKRINSKAKGNGNEGILAKKLTAALQPLNFGRSQGSGARVGGKNFATIGQMFGAEALTLFVGDVVPLNERDANVEFLWSIEAKAYKTPDTFPHLMAGKALIWAWFKEAEDDASKINRMPMLIFKWNNTPHYVAVAAFETNGHMVPAAERMRVERDGVHLDFYLLDDLLKEPEFWFRQKPERD